MANINPGLTPTVITDRNGKITTVHKKQAVSSGRKVLPAPALTGYSRSLERALEIFKRRSSSASSGDLPSEDEITKLHNLMAAGAKGGELSTAKQVFLGRVGARGGDSVRALTAAYDKKEFKQFFNNANERFSMDQMVGMAALYEPELFCPEDDTTAAQRTDSRVRGYISVFHALREMDAFESVDPNNLMKESPETFDKVKAFTHLASASRGLAPSMRDINPDLVNYAISGEADIQQVAGIIREHRTMDLATIRGIIEGAPKAVAEGWL